MDEPVFKFRRSVGKVGPHRVGPEYMLRINERAKRLEKAAEPKPSRDTRQIKLPLQKPEDRGRRTENREQG